MNSLLAAFIGLLALVKLVLAKDACAEFYNNGMNGTICFSQNDESSPVQIGVNLDGLASTAGAYHVHEYPVYFENAVGSGCGASVTGGHFNPLLVPGGEGVPGNYSCTGPSDPGCEAGDLSGKHGKLSGQDSVQEDYVDGDTGLTLFGKNSIVGRSIVIHRDSDSARWVCATINQNVETTKVVASFYGVVEGTITLTQEKDNEAADTSILVRLKSSMSTSNHKWHIHQLPVDDDCDSTGGHYNPTNVTGGEGSGVGSQFYSCNATTEEGCEYGDLYGKHGALDISTSGTNFFFTDMSLPLTGEYSVAARSIVIHASDLGGAKYTCASLGRTAIATFDVDGVSGSFKFFQSHSSAHVTTTVNINGLEQLAGAYHVHAFPVRRDNELEDGTECGSDITGGHFNLLNVTGGAGNMAGEYNCTGLTDPNCEAGDLSNKYGFLTGLYSFQGVFEDGDSGLTLFGEHTIIGRSVVIHYANDARWVCATIGLQGDIVERIARFDDSTGSVTGFIRIAQSAVDPSSETLVYMDIEGPQGTATFEHNWHVHELPVDVSGVCTSTGGHYNPQAVNGGENVPGNYLCEPENLQLCEVGDQSKKLERLNIPYQSFYVDTKLPLSGIYSIADRSIVIHAEDKGQARLDCASLETMAIFLNPTSSPTMSSSSTILPELILPLLIALAFLL